ncbi:type I secretion system permease/ATPase [Rhodoplanes sp. TEM]|uniref:Type I secretion system permease/ATPase n=1 Tax=Rhodoplanes tepidamans TaxID=200616 RepID=A0ABT5JAJ0_RHOTP|nr:MULTISPECIES: type I secretion system permease/ATPase [Rhodoplanes]MDC7786703.1 type I secretion system permease/ATPase [Rhodoplanes tepidamans]MDC7983709.1 type I secretion system permease/ATPase [Rhodoplanes sp. TEM]MDQ0358139.1 PrtD family type I secretion system ABC transporter [Rhodoplanes tepidamans]
MKRKLSSPTLAELRPLLPAYTTLGLFSFFMPVLYFAGPMYMWQVYGRVMVSRSESTLWVLTAMATTVIALMMVLDWIRRQALDRLGVAIDDRLSRSFFELLHRPKSAARAASAPSTLADLSTVRDFLSGSPVISIFDLVYMPVYVVLLALVHWAFAVVAIVIMGKMVLLALLNHVLVKGDSRRYQQMSIKAQEFGGAIARNAETVRALGMLPALRDRWYALHSKMLGWRSAGARRTEVIASIVRFSRVMQMIVIYAVGALLYLENMVAPASIMVALLIINRGIGPLDSVISNWRVYSNFLASLDRLDDLLRDAGERPRKVSLPRPVGTLALSRVSAGAPTGERMILHDISFQLAQGRTLGVVGVSGAGKSCLGRVLVGIWPIARGSLTIGDHELSHWNEDELGRHLGYIGQDVELIPGTIADNIARFDPDTPERIERIIAAAELAGIQDLVKALPEGYNTRVGPGGHVLSGGQRNRIAIARAVYGDPSLVVLDEPNSNLDAFGEQALTSMIQKLQASGTTVVIITHKVNILNVCDDILVLNGGAVQAFGSRDQIVNRIPRLKAPTSLTVIEGALDGRRS